MPESAAITVAIHLKAGEAAAGAGWHLPDGDVLTCQHVVGKASEVEVRRAGPGNVRAPYKVVAVLEKRIDEGTGIYTGDLALLRPVDEASRLRPGATCVAGHAEAEDEVDGYGFTAEYPGGQSGFGRVKQVSAVGRREILQPDNPDHKMHQGFSGCPVLSRRSKQVLGLFVLTVPSIGRGYLIPIGQIADWLKAVGLGKAQLDFGQPRGNETMDLFKLVLGHPPPQIFPLRIRKGAPATGEPASAYVDGTDLTPDEFMLELRKGGKDALLLADGGSGKSTFFVYVEEAVRKAGMKCLWLDTKRVAKLLSNRSLASLGADNKAVLDEVFPAACVWPKAWGRALDDLDQEIFVIADGINEVGLAASDLLALLRRFAVRRGKMFLAVNARSTTPLAGKEELEIYTMAQLPAAVIEAATGRTTAVLGDGFTKLLARPQMLLMWLKVQELRIPKHSEMFERYLRRGLEKLLGQPATGDTDLPGRLLNAISETTYALLRRQSPVLIFNRAGFQARLEQILKRDPELAGSDVSAERLIDHLCGYDVMQASGDTLTYHHPLYAEWLAARHFVRRDAVAWTGDAFGTISIEDSSDDGLKLAVEMVDDDRRDEFLIRMYDWRWRRVLGFAIEDSHGPTPDLRNAFIGLNALRLCDDFEHTRAVARPYFDRLDAAGDVFARKLIAASAGGAPEILAAVRAEFSGREVHEALRTWVALLDAGTDALLAELVAPPPFVGWSASNLLRVERVEAKAARALGLAYEASRTTALALVSDGPQKTLRHGVGLRWRILHTLGRVRPEAGDAALSLLLRAWRDEREHRDVRFGACRALMEIAIADEEARGTIMAAFKARLVELRDSQPEMTGVRDPEFKAMEEFWRAAVPAVGASSAEFVQGWKDSLHDGMDEAVLTAEARRWPTAEIESAVAFLKG